MTEEYRHDISLDDARLNRELKTNSENHGDDDTRYLLSTVVSELESIDPELLAMLRKAMNSDRIIAVWLVAPSRVLNGVSPAQYLAEGKRNEVLNLIM